MTLDEEYPKSFRKLYGPLEQLLQIDNQLNRIRLSHYSLGKPLPGLWQLEWDGVIEQEAWQAGFMREGSGDVVGRGNATSYVMRVIEQVAQESQLSSWCGAVGRPAAVKAIEYRQGI